MKQPDLKTDQPSKNSLKSPSHVKQATIAFLLSLIFPGLGQVYNRQPGKGLAMAVSVPVFALVFGTRLPLFFWGLVILLIVSVGWRIYVIVDAIRFSWKVRRAEAVSKRSWLSVTVLVVVILFLNIFPSTNAFLRRTSVFRAFSIPSASMCPTICVGERIVADPSAYRHRNPQRGDLIMLSHPKIKNLIIKRVIGLEGDLIEGRASGQIAINGTILEAPVLCGNPNMESSYGTEMPAFPPTKVAPGTLYVVGDNLSNSFDSRIPEFGLVTLDEIRGRPEYIYFSHHFTRIGCKLR